MPTRPPKESRDAVGEFPDFYLDTTRTFSLATPNNVGRVWLCRVLEDNLVRAGMWQTGVDAERWSPVSRPTQDPVELRRAAVGWPQNMSESDHSQTGAAGQDPCQPRGFPQAVKTVVGWQRTALYLLALGLVAWAVFDHRTELLVLNLLFSFFYLMVTVYRVLLIDLSLRHARELRVAPEQLRQPPGGGEWAALPGAGFRSTTKVPCCRPWSRRWDAWTTRGIASRSVCSSRPTTRRPCPPPRP